MVSTKIYGTKCRGYVPNQTEEPVNCWVSANLQFNLSANTKIQNEKNNKTKLVNYDMPPVFNLDERIFAGEMRYKNNTNLLLIKKLNTYKCAARPKIILF